MEVTNIKSFDLNSAWWQVIKACLEKGYERPVFHGPSLGARRKELDYLMLEITNIQIIP